MSPKQAEFTSLYTCSYRIQIVALMAIKKSRPLKSTLALNPHLLHFESFAGRSPSTLLPLSFQSSSDDYFHPFFFSFCFSIAYTYPPTL
jgi:hypothetical protein